MTIPYECFGPQNHFEKVIICGKKKNKSQHGIPFEVKSFLFKLRMGKRRFSDENEVNSIRSMIFRHKSILEVQTKLHYIQFNNPYNYIFIKSHL
jgi:hypothetical protein